MLGHNAMTLTLVTNLIPTAGCAPVDPSGPAAAVPSRLVRPLVCPCLHCVCAPNFHSLSEPPSRVPQRVMCVPSILCLLCAGPSVDAATSATSAPPRCPPAVPNLYWKPRPPRLLFPPAFFGRRLPSHVLLGSQAHFLSGSNVPLLSETAGPHAPFCEAPQIGRAHV